MEETEAASDSPSIQQVGVCACACACFVFPECVDTYYSALTFSETWSMGLIWCWTCLPLGSIRSVWIHFSIQWNFWESVRDKSAPEVSKGFHSVGLGSVVCVLWIHLVATFFLFACFIDLSTVAAELFYYCVMTYITPHTSTEKGNA